MKYITFVFLVWNLFVFIIYGVDKRRAIKGYWRIKEKFLLILAFSMGSIGSLIGMYIFRHKIKKLKFIILIPFAILFNAIVIILIFIVLKEYF